MLNSIRRLIGTNTPVPAEHRQNFAHLYWDVAFWGILNGSVVNFLGVYCSRIGASPFQMGLLTAIPAFMNMVVTLPATQLLRNRPMTRVVPVTALITRLFYALLIPLPLLFTSETRLWLVLAIVLFQNVTGTVAATMGNAFLAETVPPEWRGQVFGMRNALVAMLTMLTSLVVGQVLTYMGLAEGYMVVFALGFAGSMLSVFHLFQVKPAETPEEPVTAPVVANAGKVRLEILRGPFKRVLLMMFVLNVGVFMPNPIFPLYQVNVLHLSDQTISLAASLFWIVYFLSSTQAGGLARRIPFKRMTGLGMVIASVSTCLFTLSFNTWVYFLTQIVGGIGWSTYNNGVANYLLESVPPDDRPAYLAWYNLAVNAAVLGCGLLSQVLVGGLGLTGSMALSVTLRLLAGLVVLRFG